jgi:ribonuclease HI
LIDLTEKEILTIYTDGSVALNNNGAVGIRIISINSNGDEEINDRYSIGHQNVNSGQMEIMACTVALEEAVRSRLILSINKVVIFTDSKYVADNYKEAMFEWSKKKWLRKSGRPVPDAHLWKNLVDQIKKYNKDHIYVEIKWIKGHERNEHNKAVDEMARKAARYPLDKMPKSGPVTIFQPRKVVSSPRMVIGSVIMRGQRISIKILSGKLLKPQNIWCYQYQVVSKESPFRNHVDQIFSSLSLDTKKTYFVKFNSLTENPRIEKLYREIK